MVEKFDLSNAQLASMIQMDHRLKERMFVAKGFALLDLASRSEGRQKEVLCTAALSIFKDILRMKKLNPKHLGVRMKCWADTDRMPC